MNSRQDAEECVNDAYLALWNAIPPAKPDPLRAYICKVVRNISLKLYYKKETEKRNSAYDIAMQELEEYLPSPNTVEAEMETRELTLMRKRRMKAGSQRPSSGPCIISGKAGILGRTRASSSR